ncbi:MAG: S28 family serine protease, partial [Promethearchaeota archaeon]
MKKEERNHEYIHRTISQPVDHSDPNGMSFKQRINIIIPEGCSSSAPVYFHLGEEHELEAKPLLMFYDAYGKRNDMIYIQAEHRGYGQSITSDKDQSVLSYVRIDQALADYHNVIQTLQEEFNGVWMGAGYSYGGGLVINFAAKYPKDVNVILSSSGVIDWPFVMDTYDHQMRINFGEKLYKGFVKHIKNLEPEELFDEIWLKREFLIAACHGLAQREKLKSVQKSFKDLITTISTEELLESIHKIDNGFGNGEAWQYATSNGKKTLTREEALTEKYAWRVWRYQQCMETGVFEVSEKPNGVFSRSYKDFIEEGIALFGEEPPSAKNPEWSPRSMINDLR